MRNTDYLAPASESDIRPSRRNLLAGAVSLLACTSGSLQGATRAMAEGAGTPGRTTEAQRLARFASDIAFDKLRPSTIAAVKQLVLDTLGCALGAIDSEPARIAETTAPSVASTGPGATIIGSGRRTTASAAAFVNGTQVRYLDFLDVYFTKDVCHPSENIPPAIACVEEVGGSGRDLIEAIIVGYEAQARLCDVFAFPSINMHHGSAAGFVVPLVAGKAWRQSAGVMAHGCVLGGSRHLTLNSLLAGDLSMAKALAYSLNGAEAITAARLAGHGFTGPLASLEWLFNKVPHAQTGSISLALEPTDWRCEKVSLKRYPVQYALQAPVEAAIELHGKLQGRRDQIARIVTTMKTAQLANIADPAKFRPENRETADHSLPACVAMALTDGKLTEHQFAHERFRDADIVTLLGKMNAVGSEEMNQRFPRGRPASIEVELKDSTKHRADVEVPLGDAARPFDNKTVTEKFRELAEPAIGAAGAQQVTELVNTLDTLTTLAPLMKALRRSS
ncbi:MAG: 2-methylcitrate dehydratase [Bradyrhizobium sp.]|jgi:2-methylcitrate dehydratase|nr:2-methylcitrate dehydratase [Bradyrhizobium sp.]